MPKNATCSRKSRAKPRAEAPISSGSDGVRRGPARCGLGVLAGEQLQDLVQLGVQAMQGDDRPRGEAARLKKAQQGQSCLARHVEVGRVHVDRRRVHGSQAAPPSSRHRPPMVWTSRLPHSRTVTRPSADVRTSA